jgi:lipoyl(octanoyl) transferase
VARLGTIDYDEAWSLQRRLAALRREDLIPDTLLLLEHPHTYTLGRRGNDENILLTPAELEQRGIAVYHVDRGGDVTYHGPGQLVGYPIFRLPAERLDYVGYIRDVERALLDATRSLGVPAHLADGFSGVWLGREKLCAIGVKVDAYGVTTHGFALNVDPDLRYFENIIPCGLTDKGVTSITRVLKRRVAGRRVEHAVVEHLALAFGQTPPARVVTRSAFERQISRVERRQTTDYIERLI